MSEYLNRATRFHEAIRHSLLTEWDPIGVSGIPEAKGEYDGYVSTIYNLLIQRSPLSVVCDYLWWLEREHMGLTGDRQRTEHFAAQLIRLRDEIDLPSSDSGRN